MKLTRYKLAYTYKEAWQALGMDRKAFDAYIKKLGIVKYKDWYRPRNTLYKYKDLMRIFDARYKPIDQYWIWRKEMKAKRDVNKAINGKK